VFTTACSYNGSSNLTSTLADFAKFMMFERRVTIFAASSRLSQARILSGEAAINALASSTFVPILHRQLKAYIHMSFLGKFDYF